MTDFVEQTPKAVQVKTIDASAPPSVVDADPLECRLDNWGRCMRIARGGGGGNVCADWARLYIGLRNLGGDAEYPLDDADRPRLASQGSLDHADAWLVEQAVAQLEWLDAEALRDYYVHMHSVGKMRSGRIGYRGREVRALLDRARESIANQLRVS
jgi:hypothetical protein